LLAASTVEQHAEQLADNFYEVMRADPRSAVFLDADTVEGRLRKSMTQWLQSVFANPLVNDVNVSALVATQLRIGEVHARIQLPNYLMIRGFRTITQNVYEILSAQTSDLNLRWTTFGFMRDILDFAMELMGGGFQRFSDRSVRSDEAFRLFSLGDNMALERERQRTSLAEWGQRILFLLHRDSNVAQLPRLTTSEFGLWFNHKALSMFEGAQEIDQISELIESDDSNILPLLGARGASNEKSLLTQLESNLNSLKFLISNTFERYIEMEGGRDSLTRLLNRKYIGSVLGREIKISKTKSSRFALLLLDIDHFKNINDKYGHQIGDMVLQQTAALLLNTVRNGDFVFRYGGEEFLILLVEVTPEICLRVAETLRTRFEEMLFMLGEGRVGKVTVSIGVAIHDGHPDYQRLIGRADVAMFLAKESGRNRVYFDQVMKP